MALINYDTKEQIPEDLLDSATEITEGENKGKWTVNVVTRKKLEEFRNNNVDISKRAETAEGLLNKVFGVLGVKSAEEFDIDKVSQELGQLRDTARKVSDGKLKASDDIDKAVEERTQAMRQKFDEDMQTKQRELAAALKVRDEAVTAFKQTFVDRAVASVCNDADLGVEGTAVDDIMNRARTVFVVNEDNSIVPKRNGQTLWGEDGTTPMTMKEWINTHLRKEAPHYFKRSNGGNAGGGGDTKNYGGMTAEEFQKLPARRRLEIINEQTFNKAGR